MKTTPSRTRKKTRKAYHVATLGRAKVPVYKRTAPNGSPCFMVVNYASGKRRFDSYADESEAIEAAGTLARQMSERQVVAAAMTNEQASEYAASVQKVRPFNVSLLSAADTVAQCLPLVGGLADVQAACRFYRERHKKTTPKPISEVVAELLALKEARGASVRYRQDLCSRLNRFAADCKKDSCNVTTADVQAWLNSQKLAPQSYKNFRTCLNLLFEHCVARGYASDNPVASAEVVKVKGGSCEIFTPLEIARLLAAADKDFLPCLALGAFAGLRSAEVERLAWSDLDLTARHIVVSAGNSKTASRRIVPMADNLCAWLSPYANRTGKVWRGTHDAFYDAQLDTAAATAVEADALKNLPAKAAVTWKANARRHSFASYRFAETGDAGRVAGEPGNSAAVVHRHYRELVRPAAAKAWFAVAPETHEKILPAPAFAAAVNV